MNLADEKKALEARYGPWTAHNISLGDGFTIGDAICGNEVKLRRTVQIVGDLLNRPFSSLRVLDLACLEGGFGIEFSRQGAQVCAIEGRTASIEKARFAAKSLSLGNIEFHQDDVRNLSLDKYGAFDVVLCLGILYHLNDPDVFGFLENIYATCRRVAIIDTHVSLYSQQAFSHNGRRYMGKTVVEHAPNATADEIAKNVWASLDNSTSVYFTKPSLLSLLYDVGFTSVYECHVPQWPGQPEDRVTLVAVKGAPVPLQSCPQLDSAAEREIDEVPAPPVLRSPSLAGRLLPRRVKQFVRGVLHSTNGKQ